MALKPINDYNEPKYPKIGIVFQEPDLLLKSVPSAWRANKLIAGALISLSLVSCSTKLVPYNKSKTAQLIQNKDSLKVVETKKEAKKIAPLFVHGSGFGDYACISFISPVFISEADAMKIILSELEKYGLKFEDKYVNPEIDSTQEDSVLVPKYYNKEFDLGFDFISSSNCIINRYTGTYSLKETAKNNLAIMEKNPLVNYACFYDPVFNKWEIYHSLWDDIFGDQNYILLRKQVEDFIEWLKNEKIVAED